MSAILTIKQALSKWPPTGQMSSQELGENAAEPHLRVWNTLRVARDGNAGIGSRDLAALLRHSLRYEEERFNGGIELQVPKETVAPWPSAAIWRGHGFFVQVREDHYRIRAENWKRPVWMSELHTHRDSDSTTPLAAADGAKLRRLPRKPVPLDPALDGQFDSIKTYWSRAQAESIRGVMLSPKGSTHLIIFPTGSGKSLIGLAASTAGHGRPNGITVVIVPTVALALDQVKQARLSFPKAQIDSWESGTPESDRAQIKERIRNGSQNFLYTSPESLIGQLKLPLLEAAKQGFIQTFIVDEAHLVSQWGAAFRPSFQTMTALWRKLREITEFRTILMTATVTGQTFEDLTLFYDLQESPIEISAAVHLRAEIDFYHAPCDSFSEKETRLLEILRHAPRPAILYLTKVEDAMEWYRICRANGWHRTGLLHGESKNQERKAAIDRWRKNEIDLMVATSAFGLGMDKGDVRTVIHGCVPETIDRFYQEVGRGGRDGNAAVAIMVHDNDDLMLARKMSSKATIGDELGLARWKTMFNSATKADDSTYVVDLNSLRPDIEYAGDWNQQWNLRTLVLLARAGVLEFRDLSPPVLERDDTESEAAFNERKEKTWATYRDSCRISIKKANPLNESDWKQATSEYRSNVSRNQQSYWDAMESVLNRKKPLSEILANVYQVPEAGIDLVPKTPTEYVPSPPKRLFHEISPALEELTKHYQFITYPTVGKTEDQMAIRLTEFLKLLAKQGIREIALPSAWRDNEWYGRRNPISTMSAACWEKFLIVRTIEDEDEHVPIAPVPRVTLLPPDMADDTVPSNLFLLNRQAHLILLPKEIVDPGHSFRLIGDTRTDVIEIQTAHQRLSL